MAIESEGEEAPHLFDIASSRADSENQETKHFAKSSQTERSAEQRDSANPRGTEISPIGRPREKKEAANEKTGQKESSHATTWH